MNVPPQERHEVNLPSTSSKGVDNWVRSVIVLGLPLFADHGTGTGAETHGEAGEPEAIDRDRGTLGPKNRGWFG